MEKNYEFQESLPWYKKLPLVPYRIELYCDKENGMVPVCCATRANKGGIAQSCIFCKLCFFLFFFSMAFILAFTFLFEEGVLRFILHLAISIGSFADNVVCSYVSDNGFLCLRKRFQLCCKGINPVSLILRGAFHIGAHDLI